MTTPICLDRLRPDQWTISQHPARIKVLAMGRRWGKTVLGGSCALVVANHGGAVAWVVPTFRNGDPLWRWCSRTLAPAVGARRVRLNQGERTIRFPNGGFLGIYSADSADALRGEAFDLVVLDEAARIAAPVWSDVIQPTLADRDGRALLISTPNGLNWFWDEWLRGQQPSDELASWQAPSAANPNPRIQQAALRAAERVTERSYRQEWLAEFVEDAGTVFRRVRDCATATPQPGPLPGHSYAFGVDWAKHNDWTVITVLDLKTEAVAYLERFNQIDYHLQRARLLSLFERFRPLVIKAEANSVGEPLIDELRALGLPVQPFHTSNASKTVLLDALVLAFEHGDLTIPDDPVLIAELLAFELTQLPSGATRYAARPGQHDDCVISLALAWSCRHADYDWNAAYALVPCHFCGKRYVNPTRARPCPFCGTPFPDDATP